MAIAVAGTAIGAWMRQLSLPPGRSQWERCCRSRVSQVSELPVVLASVRSWFYQVIVRPHLVAWGVPVIAGTAAWGWRSARRCRVPRHSRVWCRTAVQAGLRWPVIGYLVILSRDWRGPRQPRSGRALSKTTFGARANA